jgi:cobalt/nickel transport protein
MFFNFHKHRCNLKTHTKSLTALTALLLSTHSWGHFQEIIPDRDFLDQNTQQPLSFLLRFTHPMAQGPMMDMQKPKQLKVFKNGQSSDLLNSLSKVTDTNPNQWQFNYTVTEPADLQFFVEPVPYWEPEEGKMIIHYSKVIVDGYGDFGTWDALVGAPVEIEPLTRPYSLWTGNTFSAIVKRNGKAVPFAEVEVEWRNDGSVTAPSDSYVTQVIKADANGTFHYSLPRAGWWGFAALIDAEYQLTAPTGKQVPVELGGLIWINAKDM